MLIPMAKRMSVPVVVHLDHGLTPECCKAALEAICRRIMSMGVGKCCVIHAPEIGCAIDSTGKYYEESSLKLPKVSQS